MRGATGGIDVGATDAYNRRYNQSEELTDPTANREAYGPRPITALTPPVYQSDAARNLAASLNPNRKPWTTGDNLDVSGMTRTEVPDSGVATFRGAGRAPTLVQTGPGSGNKYAGAITPKTVTNPPAAPQATWRPNPNIDPDAAHAAYLAAQNPTAVTPPTPSPISPTPTQTFNQVGSQIAGSPTGIMPAITTRFPGPRRTVVTPPAPLMARDYGRAAGSFVRAYPAIEQSGVLALDALRKKSIGAVQRGVERGVGAWNGVGAAAIGSQVIPPLAMGYQGYQAAKSAYGKVKRGVQDFSEGFDSYEGGGRTPSGPRVGGVDGRGGMLTVLHPDEQVTDLTRQPAPSPQITALSKPGTESANPMETSAASTGDPAAYQDVSPPPSGSSIFGQAGSRVPAGSDVVPGTGIVGGTGLFRKRFTNPKSAGIYSSYVRSLFAGRAA